MFRKITNIFQNNYNVFGTVLWLKKESEEGELNKKL